MSTQHQHQSANKKFKKSNHNARVVDRWNILERWFSNIGSALPTGYPFTIPHDYNDAYRTHIGGTITYKKKRTLTSTRWQWDLASGNPELGRCGPDDYNDTRIYSGVGIFTTNNKSGIGVAGILRSKMRIWWPFRGGVAGFYSAIQPAGGSFDVPMVLYDAQNIAAPSYQSYYEVVCPITDVGDGDFGQHLVMAYFGVSSGDIPTSLPQTSSIVPWDFQFPT